MQFYARVSSAAKAMASSKATRKGSIQLSAVSISISVSVSVAPCMNRMCGCFGRLAERVGARRKAESVLRYRKVGLPWRQGTVAERSEDPAIQIFIYPSMHRSGEQNFRVLQGTCDTERGYLAGPIVFKSHDI